MALRTTITATRLNNHCRARISFGSSSGEPAAIFGKKVDAAVAPQRVSLSIDVALTSDAPISTRKWLAREAPTLLQSAAFQRQLLQLLPAIRDSLVAFEDANARAWLPQPPTPTSPAAARRAEQRHMAERIDARRLRRQLATREA